MVLGFALLIAAGLLLDSAISGRSIADVLTGVAGAGFPGVSWTQTPSSGTATASAAGVTASPGAAAGGAVGAAHAAADAIAAKHYPYSWGGGHNAQFAPGGPHGGYDCSGAVSAVLHAAGLLKGGPMVSGQFMRYGDSGPGQHITILASPMHVFMVIDGHGWGTGHVGARDGAQWLPYNSRAGMVVRHPPGL